MGHGFAQPTTYARLSKGERYRLADHPRGFTFRKGGPRDPLAASPDAEDAVLRASEFDHAAAWADYARPAYGDLPEAVREAFALVDAREGLAQDCTLAVPIPEDLRPVLDALTTRELAEGAAVLHAVEHWQPSDAGQLRVGNRTGAGWKFANLADQVLAERLGLRSRFTREAYSGHSLRVVDGQLRAGYGGTRSHPDGEFWTWRELGLADGPEAVERARACAGPVRLESWEATAERVRAELVGREDSAALRGVLDPLQAMAPQGYRRASCPTCGGDPVFRSWTDHATDCPQGQRLRREDRIRKVRELAEVQVDALPEDIPVRGNVLASGDEDEDRAAEDAVLAALEDGEPWAWAVLRVRVRVQDWTAEAFLGGVSYWGPDADADVRRDLVPDLVHEACGELVDRMVDGEAFLRDLRL